MPSFSHPRTFWVTHLPALPDSKLCKLAHPVLVMSSTSRTVKSPSNHPVPHQFLKQLGLHPKWQFVDVYGMDPELLSMVPRPVCAVLLLFPITEKYEVFRTEEEEKIKSQGQDVKSSVYFMKQTISNACGTIGLIHAIANNKDKMHFESGSTLKKFLEESVSMSPEERARYLENYDSSSPSSSQPHCSHCRMKASSLCHHASLPWVKRNHVDPAKATSPSLRLRRWRPFLRLPSLGLHSVSYIQILKWSRGTFP
ncbi:ubiquitin carboxyl-terminal hydrolase isozyme L3 isoform X2 [Myotis lucifugus]|uniref:ubiquitin carboxyl-terminal hydrolase isozyme L3 isoform X2 n=1 Tax=Myotis lucifugus TaxID=59463 RepID=UPI000CCC4FE6|nr:ubiquitin carboxyl-terminal hydrolase isozyme L3 isoform X2 [Myotis lucifugus]